MAPSPTRLRTARCTPRSAGGTSAFDYDNDGDTDIVFHGGLDIGPFLATNPGVVLENDGSGQFSRDTVALAGSTDHIRRTVHGMAAGDLDNDGFVDIVSVSNQDFPAPLPLAPAPNLGGPFQDDAFLFFTFNPLAPPPAFLFEWAGFELDNGTLAVERSSGNGNRWLSVETIGSVGITSGGSVNRDGIGAVVKVTPKGGAPVLLPVLGGSSYASQDSLRQTAGLGAKKRATVEILWPGGVRNRLYRYRVRDGSRLLFPEIPCSIDTDAPFPAYLGCVANSLIELKSAGIIGQHQAIRLFSGAIRGYFGGALIEQIALGGTDITGHPRPRSWRSSVSAAYNASEAAPQTEKVRVPIRHHADESPV